MTKIYDAEVIVKCKHLFVIEGWGFKQISEFFSGSPSWQTVRNWAGEVDSDGKDWRALRRDHVDAKMKIISRDQIEALYMKRIYEALTDPEFNSKTSDSLRKLQSDFEKITDPTRNIPVVFAFLEELTDYIKTWKPELLTRELLEAITGFKNLKRKQLLSKYDT